MNSKFICLMKEVLLFITPLKKALTNFTILLFLSSTQFFASMLFNMTYLLMEKHNMATTNKASLSLLALAGVQPYKEKEGEEYMNEQQLLHFRKILEAWRDQIIEETSRTVTHMQDEAANFPDPADRATQEEEFSLELRARDRERKLMKKIESTLKKLETEDFGYCDSCGVEIGIRRLEARPTADLCIDCKTLAEVREKQMGY